MAATVTLAPFGADRLADVEPWFHHREVRRRLGGPGWPARELRGDPGIGEWFRGRRVLRVHSWVALDPAGAVVAKVGGDVYDRWSRYSKGTNGKGTNGRGTDGKGPDGKETNGAGPGGRELEGKGPGAVEPGPAMGLAYVVDPRRWRQGSGVATLRAVLAAPELADVVVFAAGIEPDNTASRRCATAAGLVCDDPVPDAEGMVYHVLRRAPR